MIKSNEPILNTEVTKNNRRYPLPVLENIRDQINAKDTGNFGTIGYTEGLVVTFDKVAFEYKNAVIKDEVLYADIHILETPEGRKLSEMIKSGLDMRFRTGGAATLMGEMPVETHNLLNVPKHVAEGYQLMMMAAIHPSEDAIQFKNENVDENTAEN